MKTDLQIRPNTPDSCPLLWERADEESQPEMRIMHGFTPKWFRNTMGLDYMEAWHQDPVLRRDSLVRMKQTLNEHFPDLMLGGSDPDAITGTVSVAYGTTVIASILGSPIHYMDDNWPANPPSEMTEDEAMALTVPDLDQNIVFQDLMRQMDQIEEKWGRIEGVLNFQGVLNNSFRVRGQDIFVDIALNPEIARHVFGVVTETMIKVIKAIYARQNASGVERDFFVTSNCVVNMVSGAHYEEFLLPYDQQLAEAFTYFGIHNCAWNVDAYLDGYRTIEKLGYLDFGLDSDLERIREMFPETRRCLMYSPVELQNKSLAEIESDLEDIREELSPCEIILTDIEDTTPDERVLDFYRLCGKIWKMDIRDLVPTTMSR